MIDKVINVKIKMNLFAENCMIIKNSMIDNFLSKNKDHIKNNHSPELDEDNNPHTFMHAKMNT